jgi:hypothetical protein
LSTHRSLAELYPEDVFVPFAYRQDNDDRACWESKAGKVIIVHAFAGPGWHRQGEFKNFYSWFRQAIEDLIDFDLPASAWDPGVTRRCQQPRSSALLNAKTSARPASTTMETTRWSCSVSGVLASRRTIATSADSIAAAVRSDE